LAEISLARWTLKPALWYADKQDRTIATDGMIRNFRRSGQEPDLSLMSQGENAYLVLRGVFHVSPPALGGLSIDGKLTFSNNAYLKLTTEWIMVHGELAIGSVAAPHTRKVSITFTDNVKGEDVMAGMGDRGIMIKFRALPTCCQDRGRFRLDSRRRERTRKRLERDAWQRPFARSLSPSLT
jgi:hypothetical protein